MIKRLFIDIETTSINPEKAGLWQIAGIIEVGKRKKEFEFRCDIFDDCEIDPKALETCGVTLDDLEKFDNPVFTFDRFLDLMAYYIDRYEKKDKFMVYAYFAHFDNAALRKWFQDNEDDYFGSWFFHPWVDIAQMAAICLEGEREKLTNFKLNSVLEYCGLLNGGEETHFHDALYDIRKTYELYSFLSEKYLKKN